jgi:MYXO-CTERM domain-containing protein
MGSGRVDEIDILELLGHEPDEAHMTLHWGDSYEPGHHESEGSMFVGPDFSAGFHTFGVEWTADRVRWLVDDVERFAYTGPGVPQGKLYLIANLAIGGTWPGPPDQTTVFPAHYEIDYIRAYTPADDAPDAGAAGQAGGAGDSGGASGTGGATGGAAGSSPAGGSPADNTSSGDCGCRTGQADGAAPAPWILWLALLASARRRTRQSSARDTPLNARP